MLADGEHRHHREVLVDVNGVPQQSDAVRIAGQRQSHGLRGGDRFDGARAFVICDPQIKNIPNIAYPSGITIIVIIRRTILHTAQRCFKD